MTVRKSKKLKCYVRKVDIIWWVYLHLVLIEYETAGGVPEMRNYFEKNYTITTKSYISILSVRWN